MVHIMQPSPPEEIHAYLSSPLAAKKKNDIHAIFAVGAFSRFEDPMVELILHDEPSFYNLSAESLRRAVDDAARRRPSAVDDEGNEDEANDEANDRHDEEEERPSILQIPSDWDKDAGRTAVWYISHWADAEDLASEQIVRHGDDPVLWKIFTELVEVPGRWINYGIGNMSIEEDLDMFPYDPQAIQVPSPASNDYETEGPPGGCFLIALPDEYESMDAVQSGVSYMPMPQTVYRLKEDVAERAGLISAWTLGSRPQGWPDNAIQMEQKYNVDSAVWRRYRSPQY